MLNSNNGLQKTEPPIMLQAANAVPWDSSQDESLNDFFRVVRKRKWTIIGLMVAGLAIAALVCVVMTPRYSGVATVELNKENSAFDADNLSGIASALSGESELKTQLQTESTVMQNPSVALGVIDALNLRSSEEFAVSSGLFGRSKNILKAEASLPLSQAPLTRDKLLQVFGKKLEVKPVMDTRLITVSFTSKDPAQAARVANAVVDEYRKQYLQSHYASVELASQWLTEQLHGLKSKVEESQKRLAEFQRRTGIVGLDQLSMASLAGKSGGMSGGGGSFTNPVLQKLTSLNDQLTQAEVNRVTKEAIYKLVQTEDPAIVSDLRGSPLLASGNSAVMLQGGGLDLLTSLQQQQNAAKVEYSEAVTKYGAKNPRLIDLTNRLSALSGEVRDEMKKITDRARTDFELSRKVEDGVRTQFNAQQQRANAVNDQAVEFQVLQQEAVSNQMLYENLYTKLQEANVSAGVRASNITVVDPARTAALPVSPKPPLFLALGLGAGFLLGLSGAFLMENLDRTVVATEQVEAITQGSVLGVIPDFTSPSLHRYGHLYGYGRKKSNEETLDVKNGSWLISAPESNVAEAFRAARTAILFSRAERAPKIISVTSAMPGEGKTTVVVNLAAGFAQQGARVLLVEADLRRPKIGRVLGVQHPTGLSNVLTGTADLKDAIFPYPELANFNLILAGPRPPMPAELLGSARFAEVMQLLAKDFDFIFVDTPPAMLVTDPVLISPLVDGMICIVRANRTTRPTLQRVSELLRKSNCPTLGFVLNAVNTNSADYYHYYGYSGKGDYYTEAKV